MRFKNLFFLFFLLVLVSFTYGLKAGSTETIYSISDCETVNIEVFATEEITQGEYLIEDCVNSFNETWDCNCSGSFDIRVTTLANAYNNYEFLIKYNYQYEQTEVVVSSSSSGRGRSGSVNIIYDGNSTDGDDEQELLGNNTQETETEEQEFNTNQDVVEEPVPESEQDNGNLITGQVVNTETDDEKSPYGLAAIFVLLLGAGIMFFLRKRN